MHTEGGTPVTDPTGSQSGSLKKGFGLITLIAFGIGDILGAGIYGLVGNVAGEVGHAVWLSFLAAFVVAALTGLSYAELGSRLPRSAGEAAYADAAFKRRWLSYLIGFLVLLSGIVSVSTVAHIFANYLTASDGFLPGVPPWAVRGVFLLGVAAVTFWGIRQSSAANIVCTLIEMTGLLIVILVALPYFGSVNYLDFNPAPGVEAFGDAATAALTEDVKTPIMAILAGGVLAFYSFIGFEDLANVAEEVRDPRRVLPKAILIALAIAAVFYGLVSIAAVSVVPHGELTADQAKRPLLLVVKHAAPNFPLKLFSLIALFAVANTALVNFVMGSRIIYGMARQNLAPRLFGQVHMHRRTPDAAITLILAVTLVLTLTLGKATLAGTTSFLLLVVFFVVNLSLLTMKLRKVAAEEGVMRVPLLIPILGCLATVGLATAVKPKALISFAVLAPAGIVVWLIYRLIAGAPRANDESAPQDQAP